MTLLVILDVIRGLVRQGMFMGAISLLQPPLGHAYVEFFLLGLVRRVDFSLVYHIFDGVGSVQRAVVFNLTITTVRTISCSFRMFFKDFLVMGTDYFIKVFSAAITYFD